MPTSVDGPDALLFTPGPLTTSATVKAAMLRDTGSRDSGFIQMVADIRRRVLLLGEVDPEVYTTVLMQGSGSFGLESVLSSTVPPDGKVLVLVNGAYGRRIVDMTRVLGIDTHVLEVAEVETPTPAAVDAILGGDDEITHVCVTHCETSTGIINPVAEIGEIVHRHGRQYFVDAMSSFGAVPLKVEEAHIHYLVSSANKCIEGVPGFSFVIAHAASLEATHGFSRSVSLDLRAQHIGLEANGQFRFTPPTHALHAFHRALLELEDEGGVEGRADRYRANYDMLVDGTRRLGLIELLDPSDQGYIITSFRYPEHPNFSFEVFYQRLSDRGFVIYPGKVTTADCFRIGTIGRIFPDDVAALLSAMSEVLDEMAVRL